MKLTNGAKNLIDLLTSSGYEAYAVGGAVRDSYLNSSYGDIDVTTSCTPNKMLEVFKDYKVYLTGLKHGTITVNVDGENIEVTTFRKEEGYTDYRRPDKVVFVSDLAEDLKRRDFTINAMAYNDNSGLIDIFGGISDLNNKVIRAVGNPSERFNEDALRILRAVRFASQLDFEIENTTKRAMLENVGLLKNVAVERIYVELKKTLLGKGVFRVLRDYKEVFFEIIPELKKCYNFDQKSKYHSYDVYTHIIKSVEKSEDNILVRLALLFHDVGKPDCFSIGKDGYGHFYGHQKKSQELAENILKRLKADNVTIKTVTKLIYYHDSKTDLTRVQAKWFLNKHGIEFLELLTLVKVADAKAHSEKYVLPRVESSLNLLSLAKDIIKSGECFTLKRLQIDGNDLKSLGYKGRAVKEKLEEVLNSVIELKIENKREVLLKEIEK